MGDKIEIFCPECGEKVTLELEEKFLDGRYTYKGHCIKCDKDIELEDRGFLERKGLIYIERDYYENP